MRRFLYERSILRGLGWYSNKTAPWVLEVLRVKAGSLQKFDLDTTPTGGVGSELQDWLGKTMLGDQETRDAAIKNLGTKMNSKYLDFERDFYMSAELFFDALHLLSAVLLCVVASNFEWAWLSICCGMAIGFFLFFMGWNT